MRTDTPDLAPLLAFGYTPRQAWWLRHVMRYAGAFLRRQFVAHLAVRKSGGLDQRLVSHLLQRRHALALPYHGNERLYHVRSRALYAAIGAEHSRLRRTLQPLLALQGVLLLDYLAAEPATYLGSEAEKVQCLTQEFGVPIERLPHRRYASSADPAQTTRRYFVERYPIGIADEQMRFVVPDLAPRTAATFKAFLFDYRSVLQALPRAEIVYVTARHERATAAERLYRALGAGSPNTVSTEEVEALHAYFETRRSLEQQAYGRLSNAALDRHHEETRRFADARYAGLYEHWRRGGIVALTHAAQATPEPARHVAFRHVELPWRYYYLGVSAAAAARAAAERRRPR